MDVIFDWNLGNMIYNGLITLRRCGFPFAEIRVASLGVWAVLGCVPFVFSMKETILPSLSLVLVSVPVPTLAISLAFGLFLRRAVWVCLHQLLPLLAVSLLFYVEDLLALPLLWLWLALASVALLDIFAIALELLALVLFF